MKQKKSKKHSQFVRAGLDRLYTRCFEGILVGVQVVGAPPAWAGTSPVLVLAGGLHLVGDPANVHLVQVSGISPNVGYLD